MLATSIREEKLSLKGKQKQRISVSLREGAQSSDVISAILHAEILRQLVSFRVAASSDCQCQRSIN